MTDTSDKLDQSIQLAIEAAAAANDSVSDMARVSSETEQVANRLDRFSRTFKPVLLGLAGGVVLAVGFGGLTYMRTLSEMRLTTATQTEALGLFTTTVRDLQDSLTEIDTLVADVATLKTAQEALMQRFDTTPDDSAPEALPDTVPVDLAALITAQHDLTRDAVIAAKSDLHLALARLIAEQPVEEVAAQPTPSRPAAPVVRPRARPVAENPFSYP